MGVGVRVCVTEVFPPWFLPADLVGSISMLALTLAGWPTASMIGGAATVVAWWSVLELLLTRRRWTLTLGG